MSNSFYPAYSLHAQDSRTRKPLSEDFYFNHPQAEFHSAIHCLRQVNCFIGANNSGKSRLLRALLSSVKPAGNATPMNWGLGLNLQDFPMLSALRKNKEAFYTANDQQELDAIQFLLSSESYVFERFVKVYKSAALLKKCAEDKAKWSQMVKAYIENEIFPTPVLEETSRQLKDRTRQLNDLKSQLTTQQKELKDWQNKNEEFNDLTLKIGKINQLHKLLQQKKDIESLPKLEARLENEKIPQQKRQLEQSIRTIKNLNLTLEKIEEDLIEIDELKKEENDFRQRHKQLSAVSTSNQVTRRQESIRKTELSIQNTKNDLAQLNRELQQQLESQLRTELLRFEPALLRATQSYMVSAHTLYIPILRGTRPFDNAKSDFYQQRTQQDYDKPNRINMRIFTGLSIYQDLQEHLLGTYDKRMLVKEFEDFLSESFFDKESVSLIPHIESDVVHIRIGDIEHPIYDLGDGVQALIVLTFPLFLRKNQEWAIFIEEPEAHLHPKWQRFFLDTIFKYFPKHQFFFTTHSNVFLSDKRISAYRVYKDDIKQKTAIQYLDYQHNEVLDDLGYKSSDLLNANYILWVEGISDKIYLKQCLSVFAPELEEGIHYSIMFFGGCTNLLQHVEIDAEASADKIGILALNPRCGFILDSDLSKGEELQNAADEKAKYAFREICRQKKLFCWVTESVREWENYIPLDIWKEAAVDYAQQLSNNRTYSLTTNDVELTEPDFDPNFSERIGKKKGTRVWGNREKNICSWVNDKVLMAKIVAKRFPLAVTDIPAESELHQQLVALVQEIQAANQLEV